MGWRKNGDNLRATYLRAIECGMAGSQHAAGPGLVMVRDLRKPGPIFHIRAPHGPVNLEFLEAACNAEFDNQRGPLIRYLTKCPLGKPEQVALAQTLRKSERKNGRPVNVAILANEAVASMFYSHWLLANKRNGIRDYGHRAEMREIAVNFALEVASKYPSPASRLMPKMSKEIMVERILELMRRPNKRKPSFDSLINLMIEAENRNFRRNH
jgi:hypothetical protein